MEDDNHNPRQEPDYSRLTLEQLRTTRKWIDEARFPERARRLDEWIVKRVVDGDIPGEEIDYLELPEPVRGIASSHLTKGILEILGAASAVTLAYHFMPAGSGLPDYFLTIIWLSATGLFVNGVHELYLFATSR